MTGIRDLNIRAKLTLMTVATAAIALVCVVAAFVVHDLQLVKRIKAEQVATQISVLSGNLAHALAQRDINAVDNLLQNSASAHGIIAATVYDNNGNTLSQYPFVAGKLTPISNPEAFDFSSRTYRRPITGGGNTEGELEVLVSYADVGMRMVYMAGYSLMAFLFAIAIAVVVARLVQKLVSEPLIALHRLSQDVVETGNYNLRVPISGHDELGQLGDVFNRMLSQIEQRDLMMENRVEQRTRELQKLAEEFRYRALHDNLTGLPNRALLHEEFARAAAHANRTNKHFAVLMLDLDNFKHINDRYGHDAGDEMLKLVAQKVRSALRAEDLVCRLGGDEFVVLLEGVDNEKHIEAVGESLLRALQVDFSVAGRPLAVGISIGASIYPQHGSDINELKRNADIAMYCAKESGKNRLVVYQSTLDKASANKVAIRDDLKNAVARDELELYFQPQVNELTHHVVGCEVLLRWHHRSFGCMQPVDFIPFAEECGMIHELDYYVLHQACRQAVKWRSELDLDMPVSVNLSTTHFYSEEIVDELRAVLLATGLPAALLTVELAEADLLEQATVPCGVIAAIRGLGVRIALENFGVGYVSLQHLRSLQVDSVKLDRSVHRCVTRDQNDVRLTKGILALTCELGLDTIAEGVEDVEQVHALTSLGCHVMQGYAYTAPIPALAFTQWLKAFHENVERHPDLSHTELVD